MSITHKTVAKPVADEVFASKYFDQIIKKDELKDLGSTLAEIQRENNIADQHSLPALGLRQQEAAQRYADNPTPENFEELRKLKVLDSHECSRVQLAAMERARLAAQKLTPTIITVCVRAAECAAKRASEIERVEMESASDFGLPHNPSPVVLALRSNERSYRAYAGVNEKRGFGHIPDLLVAIHKLAAK